MEMPVVIYDEPNVKHRPAAAGETIPVDAIPISEESGNSLTTKPDGLYVPPGGSGGSHVVGTTPPTPVISTGSTPTRQYGTGDFMLTASAWLEVAGSDGNTYIVPAYLKP